MDFNHVDHRAVQSELATQLGISLASTYAYAAKAQGFHWNVKGPDFSEFHEFFSEIYSDAHGAIDDLAENILKLGYDAPASLGEFKEMSVVDDCQCTSDEPILMSRTLLTETEKLIDQIMLTASLAEKCREFGIMDFLAGREYAHKKWAWQLRAITGLQSRVSATSSHSAEIDVVIVEESPEVVEIADAYCPYCEGVCECTMGDCICPDYCSCGCRNRSMIAAPAPKKDQIKGSDKNKPGSAAGGKKIVFSDKVETALKNKVAEHNEKAPAGRKATLGMLKAVYRRGAGAFSSSHRPGKTRDQWAMARVNAYLKLLKSGSPANPNYKQDNDLLPAKHPKSTNSADAVIASAVIDEELTIELLDEIEYATSEHAIVAMAEYSGLGYEIVPALKSAWIRGVESDEDPFSRAKELAVDLYDSRDADLLPRTEK